MHVRSIAAFDLGQPIGQCRAAPLNLGPGSPAAFFAAWGADFDVDPYTEMFFFPTDTLKLGAFTVDGSRVWQTDLGRGVVPGMWFTPFLPLDLDGTGRDAIWTVGTSDPAHPLSLRARVLRRIDSLTGATTGEWPWPVPPDHWSESLSHQNRNFLLAGRGRDGRPVLITAQGTYAAMALQGWTSDGSGGIHRRWETLLSADSTGARGSHMCPVVDWDGDGADEFFWGERLLRCDDGSEVWCADRDTYDGHSDVIQPVHLPGIDPGGDWFLYTCRETERSNQQRKGLPQQPMPPRIAFYGPDGSRRWGRLDEGHIDIGWIARTTPNRHPLAGAVRIGKKTCGPDGRFHQGVEEFLFDALTGSPAPNRVPTYKTLPVDLDGDGCHEFVRGDPGGDGALFDAHGASLGSAGGGVAMASRFVPSLPGEQLLVYTTGGSLRVVADADATRSAAASARYDHAFYAANQRLTATGSNLRNLGGL